MKDEYNEYYKTTDCNTFNEIQKIRLNKIEWRKQWNDHAKWLGFDSVVIRKDHSCLGFFQSFFSGFAISFNKINLVDNTIYKLVGVDKYNQRNIYAFRKGNKKKYAEFKELADSIGLSKNLNDLGELLFPEYKGHQYPIGTINWNESNCSLFRVVWSGRKKSETKMNPSLVRIKESEYLALQGK